MKLSYIDLRSTRPDFNLAAEQYVFDSLPRDRMYFMLWRNDNAIIIGKFQNTLAEINADYVKEKGIAVVRRLSGGGAVYHDLGNLNFTFICDAGNIEELNVKLFCEPVVEALRKMGVPAELNGRNDICVEGAKVSGNSQYLRQGRIMHHGTLLFDSDLSVVEEALKVDEEKIKAKGHKSVRSRVTDLRPWLAKDIGMKEFRKEILNSILSNTPGEEYLFSPEDLEAIEKLRLERYSRWDWNYGFSPECSIVKSRRFPDVGRIEARMDIDKGIIKALSFSGDFFSTREPEKLAALLLGTKAQKKELEKRLSAVRVSAYFSGLETGQLAELLST